MSRMSRPRASSEASAWHTHRGKRRWPKRLEQGHAALKVMEAHLDARTFFVAERYSIADIALFATRTLRTRRTRDLASYPKVSRLACARCGAAAIRADYCQAGISRSSKAGAARSATGIFLATS